MQVRVNLPNGSMIDYWGFCMAIAEALCPTRAQHYQGVACIVGKMVKGCLADNEKWSFPAEFQTMSPPKGERTLGQLSRSQHGAGEATAHESPSASNLQPRGADLSLPYQLTEADRHTLSEHLPDLPPLQYPISDADKNAFLDAWSRLKNRPTWEPILVTAAYIDRRKNEQLAVLAQHQTALQAEFVSGKLDALNEYHAPVKALMAGSFISRQQATAYLERRGIAHSDMRGGEDRGGVVPKEAELPAKACTAKRKNVGEPKYSKEKRRQIADESRALREARKPHIKPIAEFYGYSNRQVYNLVKEADQEDQERQEAVSRVVVRRT